LSQKEKTHAETRARRTRTVDARKVAQPQSIAENIGNAETPCGPQAAQESPRGRTAIRETSKYRFQISILKPRQFSRRETIRISINRLRLDFLPLRIVVWSLGLVNWCFDNLRAAHQFETFIVQLMTNDE
jgi:hypothetical protein